MKKMINLSRRCDALHAQLARLQPNLPANHRESVLKESKIWVAVSESLLELSLAADVDRTMTSTPPPQVQLSDHPIHSTPQSQGTAADAEHNDDAR